MNKKDIQKRVLKNNKPLTLNKFSWDKTTNTFSSSENDLILDFYHYLIVLKCTEK